MLGVIQCICLRPFYRFHDNTNIKNQNVKWYGQYTSFKIEAGRDDVMNEELIRSALGVLDNSYAPYSHFHVAAAVLTDTGNVYTGVNVENASYPAGICAECNAVAKAVSCGERKIRAVAIVGRDSQGKSSGYVSPCGICRQVLREFSVPQELKVILAKDVGDYKETTLEELLPASFGPESLG